MSDFVYESAPVEEIGEGTGVVPEPSLFPPLEPFPAELPAEKVTPLSVLMAVFTIPIAAVIIGWLWHFIGRIDVLFISAIFAGIGAGCLVGFSLAMGRTRHQTFVASCGIIVSILTMVSRYTWDAYAVRPAMVAGGIEYFSGEHSQLTKDEVRARVENSLNPWATLKWYMRVQSETGIAIGRAEAGVTSEKPVRLTGFFFWGLVILETGAMALAGGITSTMMSTKRYCAECNMPLKENLLFRRHSDQAEDVLVCAQKQDWHGLMSLPKTERTDLKNMTDVILHRCEARGCPATLSVEKQTGSDPRKRLLNAWISPESANAAREASLAEPI